MTCQSTNHLDYYISLGMQKEAGKENFEIPGSYSALGNMYGFRKFYQRGSDIDVFIYFFFIHLVDGRGGGRRGSKYHYKRAIISLSAKRYLNGVKWCFLACQ